MGNIDCGKICLKSKESDYTEKITIANSRDDSKSLNSSVTYSNEKTNSNFESITLIINYKIKIIIKVNLVN